MQQYRVNNQLVVVDGDNTVITITYDAHPEHVHRFKFNLLTFTGWDELREKDYPVYWWLGTLVNQIKRGPQQLTLEI